MRLLSIPRLVFSAQRNISTTSLSEHPYFLGLSLQYASDKDKLDPINQMCNYILGQNMEVNRKILSLNITQRVLCMSTKIADINKLKRDGLLNTGRFTLEHDTIILNTYNDLVTKSAVNKEEAHKDLFLKYNSKLFHLQRNAIGFYLLQNLPDGDKRLPVEVFTRLHTLQSPGAFSQKEDTAIMAWVRNNGAAEWTKLAASLGRTYIQAGPCVFQRHLALKNELQGKKTGHFEKEEIEVVIQRVLRQKQDILDDLKLPAGIDWDSIASDLNRSRAGVYRLFVDKVHPTLRRYLAQTLDQDVRPELVKAIKKEGWTYSVQVDFLKLAGQHEFRGHTRGSLQRMYAEMVMDLVRASPVLNSVKEVTVEQVSETWENGKKHNKDGRTRDMEQIIVNAYLRVVAEKDVETRRKQKSKN